jgi:hypothetical protein
MLKHIENQQQFDEVLKEKKILVDVLSGFENPDNLKMELATLTYGGSDSDIAQFNDLFATTWGSNILQATNAESLLAVDDHLNQETRVFENLYQSGSSSYLVPWNYVSVATLIAMVPVVLLFAFLQKQFMQSVAGTGIKG